MSPLGWFGALILSATLTAPAFGQQTIYRWLNPETGQYVTTPTLPSYPIKEKRPGANLSGIDLYNVDLDMTSPAVKAAIEKREAAKAEERRKEQARAEQKSQHEQAERDRRQAERERAVRTRQEAEEMRQKYCTGPLSFGIKLGMPGEHVRACLLEINNGHPDKINTTTTAAGLREQWIYRIGSHETWYFYFSNGRLTAIQQ